MQPSLLTKAELKQAREKLPGWLFREDRISRTLLCKDFGDAFSTMCRIAFVAERLDHHPEWLNVFNRIDVVLTTHDVSGLSANDVALALAIDEICPCGGTASD